MSLYSKKKKTTAGKKTMDQMRQEVMVAFTAMAIPPTIQLWLCIKALVGSDGSL